MMSGPDELSPSAGSARFDVAIDLWLRAKLGGGGHNATCRCGGIPHVAPSAGDIEHALLDYLCTKYTVAERGDLARLVKNRINEGAGARGVGAFEYWLRSLKNQALQESDRDSLLEDVITTLSSVLNPSAA